MDLSKERYDIDSSIFRCDYIRYRPPAIFFASSPCVHSFKDILREAKAVSLKGRFLDLDFEVTVVATNNLYMDGSAKKLVFNGPIGFSWRLYFIP